MFIDPWMIGVLALTFGVCAYWNHRRGTAHGMSFVLQQLVDEKIIAIENGQVVPYRNAWAPKPIKRRRATKVAK